MKPWTDPTVPWWIRQRRLYNAAHEHGDKFIILKRGEYGPSAKRAAEETDAFYKRHEKEALYAGRKLQKPEQMELFA